ncbi:DNA-binding transcriptional regulator, MerR family [Collimonas sp. OK607]|uniref:MerR family transcriptional regulator n=1 Tax=Collimonas sp. OK607 TaxID=1798194 RepID=UPI0008E506B2|nr:MerR family transcriptional regulator [Collimonas sp. OK607]SFB34185.1 DNA-binding transcriptional regulator, MerR family [Collimonas sp. OK607]
MATTITIQQAATATGLSIHTLRYYEKIGLIDPVPRQSNQHRMYRQEDLIWIGFLLRLRATGMSIQKMLRYAELRRLGEQIGSVSERKVMLEQHTVALEAELLELQETLVILRDKVALYADLERKLKATIDA